MSSKLSFRKVQMQANGVPRHKDSSGSYCQWSEGDVGPWAISRSAAASLGSPSVCFGIRYGFPVCGFFIGLCGRRLLAIPRVGPICMNCLGIARRSGFRRIMVDDESFLCVRFWDFENSQFGLAWKRQGSA